MSSDWTQLANEAIQLETQVGRLYLLFGEQFPEDAAFWEQLAIEENNHAELIRTGVDFFMKGDVVPEAVLSAPLASLQAANRRLSGLLEKYTQQPPSRAEAFYAALATENSAGEIHFQRMVTGPAESRVVELFQQLNTDDKDHADRIVTYMRDHRIDTQP